EKNIITGQKFKTDGDSEIPDSDKASEFVEYAEGLSGIRKAELYTEIMSAPSDEYIASALTRYKSEMTREMMEEAIVQNYVSSSGLDESKVREYVSGLDDDTFNSYIDRAITESISEQYAQAVQSQLSVMTNEQMAAALDALVASADETALASYRDLFMDNEYSETDYEETLSMLGYVDRSKPSSINIFASTFENKDRIGEMIEEYNKGVSEEDQLSYTDYVKLLMSSVTTIINAISYVLIAFVAISLIVSSIMIGIITYISVLERTKEIGILRAIGASKRDVSRVFNAETIIVGLTSGLIGIALTVVLCLPINAIIHSLTGIYAINAQLPAVAGIILVVISVLLTVIAGLVPARIAAKKDPVEALRTE
ncbi:MAG: ABC transporter permease, partial [Acutalibacteraceae bacterium]